MKRTIYDSDHEAFRASVKEFLDRRSSRTSRSTSTRKRCRGTSGSRPASRASSGLEVPEEYGGSEAGDYRFNAVLTEELAKVNMALPSCVGIHADIVAPYLVHLTTEEQKKRWLPGFCSGELLTAIGDDRAQRRLRPRQPQDHRRQGRRRLGHQRVQDVHHQRLLRRPGGGRGAHRRRRRRRAASPCSASRPTREGFSRGRKLDKVGQDESDTAELFFEDVRVPDANIIGELDEGFIHMMNWLPQERLGSAITNLAHAAQILDETIEYAKERKAFGQPIGPFQHNKFLLAELVTQVEVTQAYVDQCVLAHTARRADRRSTPPRPSGGPPRCRTTCSTTASSCTAATAT